MASVMNNDERVAEIERRLKHALQPSYLDVEDESYLHAGHEGAKSGKGHFALKIVAEQFKDMTPLARHRLIYSILGELMNTDIHALRITANAP